MNHKAAVESVAVAASAPLTLVTAGVQQTFISLAVGLIGVWLARIVFVNRENRRLDKRAPFMETLPVTAAACLIAGVVIYDQQLGISASAFIGLGVGWTTVVLLELFGDRAVNALRVLLGMDPIPHSPLPTATEIEPTSTKEFDDLLREVDRAAPDYERPSK